MTQISAIYAKRSRSILNQFGQTNNQANNNNNNNQTNNNYVQANNNLNQAQNNQQRNQMTVPDHHPNEHNK